MELHGGGIDVEGVTFPGASPYPLIGHGIDFAWSGTSANGDNEDTFAEKLCNADGSAPARSSTSYMYKGKCIPFTSRTQSLTTPYSALQGTTTPPTSIVYRTLRSVTAPVSRRRRAAASRRVGEGERSRLPRARRDHSVRAPGENKVSSARQFMNTMGLFPGTENWFYVDQKSVAFQQSGNYPLHARGFRRRPALQR